MSTQLRRTSVLGICLLLLVLAFFTSGRPFSFVDAHTYSAAIRDQLAGADPYVPRAGLNFVYPPVVILVATGLAKTIPLSFLKAIYIMLHLSATLLLPVILYRNYLRRSSWSLASFYGFFFLAPGFMGLLALDTGNIAVICYAFTLWAGGQGIKGNRWSIFYIVVFCCSMVKITFAPLLLLPVLCGTGQLLLTSLCGSGVLICSGLQAWLTPDLYRNFKAAVSRQLILLGDNGKGLFGILFHLLHKFHHPSMTIPVLGYVLVASCVLVCLVVIRQRGLYKDLASWPAIVLAGTLFVTPRVNYYDLCLAFPIVFCIWTESFERPKAVAIYVASLLPSLAFMMRMRDSAFNGGFETLLILAMLIIVFRRILSQPVHVEPSDAPFIRLLQDA